MRNESCSVLATKRLAECIYSAGSSMGSRLLPFVSGSGAEIVSASIDPMDYSNADTFRQDYLTVELMSKFPDWDLGIDRREVALRKFMEAELQCLHANKRLMDLGANSKISVSTERVILTARRKIQALLGPFSWVEALRFARFGPGATVTKSRRHRDTYYKITDGQPSCSWGLLPYLYLIRNEFPWWDFEAVPVKGSKVVTVPKSAKTDRTIGIEPDLNVFIQLGIGRCLRRRLLRVGLLDPKLAQHNNAKLAREGSSTGRLATIDLSAASDTISRELVRAVMPEDWLSVLERTRAPVARLNGDSIPLEKFSAMGNGYTFELETLIFWALTQSVLATNSRWDQRTLVYGDDIIADSDSVTLLSEVFEEVGFTMNPKKTFSKGPFRESCGKHYFNGVDVSPFYLRKSLTGDLDWYWAANTVRRFSRLPVWGLDSSFKHAYDYCVSQLSERAKAVKIPEGVGDGGLVADFDEVCPGRTRHPDGWEGWVYTRLSHAQPLRRASGERGMYKSLYQLDHGSPETHVDIPLSSQKLKRERSYVQQWPSYGSWME